MPEEFFDIVDEKNIPTGERRLRSEVHAYGYWHRAVHVYLFRRTPHGIEFLTHLRAKNKDLHPDSWDTRFGGHVAAGASIEETAIREVKEEIGLDISQASLHNADPLKSEHPPNNEYTYPFFLEFEHEEGLVFNDGEVQKVEWMHADDIIDSMQEKSRPWAGSLKGFTYIYQELKSKL